MTQNRRFCFRRALLLASVVLVLMGMASCGTQEIVFVYPDEALDFQLRNLKMPAVYIDTVTDLRPLEQRSGEGHFFTIIYPKDDAWEVPATQIYAEALAQDLDQTNLVELVPLHAQADYILSMDLLSLSCKLKRSPASFLLAGAIGAGAGMALGDDASHRIKLGAVLAAITMVAVPVPTNNHAEAEVQLTLKDRTGNILWQKSCLGEVDEKKYLTATAREDQQLVNEHLTKAVKRANACLLGQMRQYLLENAGN
ncbi:MAG: hypothetical protein QNL91_02590 [Candidatus Krumholzibacteria bacterium]|nr:hypothetical protein [Candidatus Krumholzibacteria bacterium]